MNSLHGVWSLGTQVIMVCQLGLTESGIARGDGDGSLRFVRSEADLCGVDGPCPALRGALVPPVHIGVRDHLLWWRRAVLASVHRRVRVADQCDVVAANDRPVERRADARAGAG